MQADSRPLISAVVPCYNQARFLEQAIRSVLEQSYPNVEVVVVDDGSTDDTAAVAQQFDSRVRYVHQENQGLSAARNTGLRHAKGDLIHFLDSDDFVAPDMYERVVETAALHPDAGVFSTDWLYVDQNGNDLARYPADSWAEDALSLLLEGNRFPPCAAIARRSTVETVGKFKVALRSCEDWDFWIRAASAGTRFAPVQGAGAMYRRYEGTMSTNHRRMWEAGLQVLNDSANLPGLSPRHRELLRNGRVRWRRYCFKRLLQAMHKAPPATRLSLLMDAIATDVGLVPLFAAHGFGKFRNATAVRRRAQPSPEGNWSEVGSAPDSG